MRSARPPAARAAAAPKARAYLQPHRGFINLVLSAHGGCYACRARTDQFDERSDPPAQGCHSWRARAVSPPRTRGTRSACALRRTPAQGRRSIFAHTVAAIRGSCAWGKASERASERLCHRSSMSVRKPPDAEARGVRAARPLRSCSSRRSAASRQQGWRMLFKSRKCKPASTGGQAPGSTFVQQPACEGVGSLRRSRAGGFAAAARSCGARYDMSSVATSLASRSRSLARGLATGHVPCTTALHRAER